MGGLNCDLSGLGIASKFSYGTMLSIFYFVYTVAFMVTLRDGEEELLSFPALARIMKKKLHSNFTRPNGTVT
jgi:hypothetical protein